MNFRKKICDFYFNILTAYTMCGRFGENDKGGGEGECFKRCEHPTLYTMPGDRESSNLLRDNHAVACGISRKNGGEVR
jgi:hypothetical protein